MIVIITMTIMIFTPRSCAIQPVRVCSENQILSFIQDSSIDNVVFLTGDVHSGAINRISEPNEVGAISSSSSLLQRCQFHNSDHPTLVLCTNLRTDPRLGSIHRTHGRCDSARNFRDPPHAKWRNTVQCILRFRKPSPGASALWRSRG